MAVPKRRTGKSRRDRRRANYNLSAPTVTSCPNCHKEKAPHRACPNCGFYNGRHVVQVKSA
ncbi:50S ribosomal protein L32 [candidate division KSB1 bacterium]|nr:50S ribosomal protein L32 [candidate division KSB1 bacterium]